MSAPSRHRDRLWEPEPLHLPVGPAVGPAVEPGRRVPRPEVVEVEIDDDGRDGRDERTGGHVIVIDIA